MFNLYISYLVGTVSIIFAINLYVTFCLSLARLLCDTYIYSL